MNFFTQGAMLEVESTRTCVLYDKNDGRIVHQHEVVNFRGAKRAEDTEVEAVASRMAAQLGHDVSNVKALHFSSDEYSTEKCYKIDTESLRLIEIPLRRS
jgi:hypothetical protein